MKLNNCYEYKIKMININGEKINKAIYFSKSSINCYHQLKSFYNNGFQIINMKLKKIFNNLDIYKEIDINALNNHYNNNKLIYTIYDQLKKRNLKEFNIYVILNKLLFFKTNEESNQLLVNILNDMINLNFKNFIPNLILLLKDKDFNQNKFESLEILKYIFDIIPILYDCFNDFKNNCYDFININSNKFSLNYIIFNLKWKKNNNLIYEFLIFIILGKFIFYEKYLKLSNLILTYLYNKNEYLLLFLIVNEKIKNNVKLIPKFFNNLEEYQNSLIKLNYKELNQIDSYFFNLNKILNFNNKNNEYVIENLNKLLSITYIDFIKNYKIINDNKSILMLIIFYLNNDIKYNFELENNIFIFIKFNYLIDNKKYKMFLPFLNEIKNMEIINDISMLRFVFISYNIILTTKKLIKENFLYFYLKEIINNLISTIVYKNHINFEIIYYFIEINKCYNIEILKVLIENISIKSIEDILFFNLIKAKINLDIDNTSNYFNLDKNKIIKLLFNPAKYQLKKKYLKNILFNIHYLYNKIFKYIDIQSNILLDNNFKYLKIIKDKNLIKYKIFHYLNHINIELYIEIYKKLKKDKLIRIFKLKDIKIKNNINNNIFYNKINIKLFSGNLNNNGQKVICFKFNIKYSYNFKIFYKNKQYLKTFNSIYLNIIGIMLHYNNSDKSVDLILVYENFDFFLEDNNIMSEIKNLNITMSILYQISYYFYSNYHIGISINIFNLNLLVTNNNIIKLIFPFFFDFLISVKDLYFLLKEKYFILDLLFINPLIEKYELNEIREYDIMKENITFEKYNSFYELDYYSLILFITYYLFKNEVNSEINTISKSKINTEYYIYLLIKLIDKYKNKLSKKLYEIIMNTLTGEEYNLKYKYNFKDIINEIYLMKESYSERYINFNLYNEFWSLFIKSYNLNEILLPCNLIYFNKNNNEKIYFNNNILISGNIWKKNSDYVYYFNEKEIYYFSKKNKSLKIEYEFNKNKNIIEISNFDTNLNLLNINIFNKNYSFENFKKEKCFQNIWSLIIELCNQLNGGIIDLFGNWVTCDISDNLIPNFQNGYLVKFLNPIFNIHSFYYNYNINKKKLLLSKIISYSLIDIKFNNYYEILKKVYKLNFSNSTNYLVNNIKTINTFKNGNISNGHIFYNNLCYNYRKNLYKGKLKFKNYEFIGILYNNTPYGFGKIWYKNKMIFLGSIFDNIYHHGGLVKINKNWEFIIFNLNKPIFQIIINNNTKILGILNQRTILLNLNSFYELYKIRRYYSKLKYIEGINFSNEIKYSKGLFKLKDFNSFGINFKNHKNLKLFILNYKCIAFIKYINIELFGIIDNNNLKGINLNNNKSILFDLINYNIYEDKGLSVKQIINISKIFFSFKIKRKFYRSNNYNFTLFGLFDSKFKKNGVYLVKYDKEQYYIYYENNIALYGFKENYFKTWTLKNKTYKNLSLISSVKIQDNIFILDGISILFNSEIKFEGNFNDQTKEGIGIFFKQQNNKIIFKGKINLKNNNFFGVFNIKSKEYKGNFINNLLNGIGIISNSFKNKIVEGYFINNLLNGKYFKFKNNIQVFNGYKKNKLKTGIQYLKDKTIYFKDGQINFILIIL